MRMSRSIAVLGGVVLAAVLSTRWLTVNITASVPLGLYRKTAVPQLLRRGDLVILPVPEALRPWHSRFLPLLKPVAGVSGDAVCLLDGELWVAGVGYGPVYQEAQGKPLPHVTGCLIVQLGDVYIASPVEGSLDSRYLGPVPITALTAGAVPLLTWQ